MTETYVCVYMVMIEEGGIDSSEVLEGGVCVF